MKARGRVAAVSLLALALLTLAACGSSSTAGEGGEGEGFWSRLTGFFSDVTHRLAAAPLIGPWFTKLQGRLAPQHQWCIGGLLGVLLLVVLAAVVYRVRD